jgi:hypothetical protein
MHSRQQYNHDLNNAIAHTTPNSQVWVSGDFNLGEINWSTYSTTSTNQQANQLIDIADDHGLTQIVEKPTRITETSSNILDLFFTNSPGLVNRYEIIPGISDHDIPLLDISTRIVLNKTKPRKIYQYNKVNYEGIDESITKFAKGFYTRYSTEESWNVDAMWEEFKTAMLESIDLHVPSKQISSKKQSLPWITPKIKKEIRKRNRLFEKAKNQGSSEAKQLDLPNSSCHCAIHD